MNEIKHDVECTGEDQGNEQAKACEIHVSLGTGSRLIAEFKAVALNLTRFARRKARLSTSVVYWCRSLLR